MILKVFGINAPPIYKIRYDLFTILMREITISRLKNAKVKFWALASRSCVTVDREPSGHLVEYSYVKSVRALLALLRPEGRGSTYMIGDDQITDFGYINVFEFKKSPLEVIGTAITWTEELVKKRIEKYKKAYPWRR